MKGYFATYTPSIILSFNSDEERKKLCNKNRNKSYRYAEGEDSYETLERWLIEKRKSTCKVALEDVTYYFQDKERAQEFSIENQGELIEISGSTKQAIGIKDFTPDINFEPDVIIDENIDSFIEEGISKFEQYIVNIRYARAKMYEELAVCDKKIVDIEHAMEFQKLGASDGYKLYKLMHDTLNERRRLKDNISKVEMVLTSRISDSFGGGLTKKVSRLEKRTYKPRVLTELFE